ncbi:MAG: 50S ribosomal protein L7ae [Nanoarchaeota archaeon]|nr:50S ribosomal protein L7ae [Nanoarchaeota archaeon]
MAATYAKVEVPKELAEKALEIVEIARNSGKIKKGLNETTKAVEREKAKLVVVANDINPPEIVMHLPPLCEEKKIPFIVAASKSELGTAAGLEVPTSAVAILDAGDAKKQLAELTQELEKLNK